MISKPRRVFVAGGSITKFIGAKHPDFIYKKHPDFGKKENPDLEQYIHWAVNDTLVATGVPGSIVDKAWIGNFAGELFCKQVRVSPKITQVLSVIMKLHCILRAIWVLQLRVQTRIWKTSQSCVWKELAPREVTITVYLFIRLREKTY